MLKLPAIYSNRMVLQRERYVQLCGEGKGKVFAEIAGVSSCAWSYDGKWTMPLPPLPVGGPYTLTLRDDDSTVTFTDVLVGDVFLAAGQSNMEYPLFLAYDGLEAAEHCDNPNIRLFTVPREKPEFGGYHSFEYTPDETTPWQYCNEEQSLYFSAIGFWFAQKLQAAEHVPVGIISCNYGGTNIEAWIPRERVFSVAAAEQVRLNHVDWLSQIDVDENRRLWATWITERSKCSKPYNSVELVKKYGLDYMLSHDVYGVDAVAQPFGGPYHACWAGVQYDNMLSKVIPYSLKAVLWYQGENNVARGSECYCAMFETMVRCWRYAFDDENLPFFTVQIAPYEYDNPDGCFRVVSQQIEATKRIPGVYMITSSDLGFRRNIHPPQKKVFAERLFLAAERELYGKSAEYSGPIAECAYRNGDTVTVRFTHADSGLCCDGNVTDLFVQTADGEKHGVSAAVEGNCLQIRLKQGSVPAAVLMGTDCFPNITLYNRDGLIAAPFFLPITAES